MASAAAMPLPAAAAVGFAALPQSLAQLPVEPAKTCDTRLAPAFGSVQRVSAAAAFDKSAAILGGHSSRLAMIQRQQGGDTRLASAAQWPVPNLGGARQSSISQDCQQLASVSVRSFVTRSYTGGPAKVSPALDNDDFLASKRLAVSHTNFDSSWRRVSDQRLSPGAAKGMARLKSGSATTSTLAAVNAWTNAKIRYVEDSVLYGRADYWAGAKTTLKRGAGDCEDIAIVKMQLLAAAGISRSDMYLTIARDLVRNADHAVLIVKLDGRHWLLDNSTNALLDASQSHDYRPIMSFSADHKWLHGYSQL